MFKVKVKPISPDEAIKAKKVEMPDQVIEAFNELIVKNLRNEQAIVLQHEVVRLINSKTHVSNDQIFENGWLNVEDLFRNAGWSVVYNKPGFNESYEAKYTFKRK